MLENRKLRLGSIIFAILGLADAIYLTWVKLAHRQAYCGTYGGCETVGNSSYSTIGGIPIALFGAAAYLAILALLYLESKGGFWQDNATLLVFGITLAGVLYSAYLTYIELAVLQAICFYCVVSAIVMLILFILTILRLVQGQAETNPI